MLSAQQSLAALSEITARLGRARHLDQVLTVALDSLAELFGFEHSIVMLLDETGASMFTIASRGYEPAGIGSEVRVGDGVLGRAIAEVRPVRIGNLQRLLAYARTASEHSDTDMEIPLPGLPDANSQLAAPAVVRGHALGVVAIECADFGAFTAEDESLLAVIAHLVAAAVELDRETTTSETPDERLENRAPTDQRTSGSRPVADGIELRFYSIDGSTFLDGDYLIKGVPGRILWRLANEHTTSGRTEFTNRELRLDPTLDLPTLRDNLESRLILLKRRLDERNAPLRIERTGRGTFRLHVTTTLRLESINRAE